MATPSSKKPVMTLYSSPDCVYAHRVRFVLEEKSMEYQVVEVDLKAKPEDLMELNPYGEVPTLVDRDLVLYDSMIIMEYLDERFPHPPLTPVDPISRAKARLLCLRFNRDWLDPLFLPGRPAQKVAEAKQLVREGLTAFSTILSNQRFLFGEELSLVDCALAPLLWRLPVLGITLPAAARSTTAYMERLFERESFQRSLTAAERAMR